MIDLGKLCVGDKVCYQPEHYRDDEWENGIVKEIPGDQLESVRVVYNCAGDWKNYADYTSALTNSRDLYIGWRHSVERPQSN